MSMDIRLLVIDPQNSFCSKTGSLFVPGADEDMERLATMVTRLQSKLSDICITMDSHRVVDISHPGWWKDSSGAHPAPFTQITAKDLETGVWTTSLPGAFQRSLKYLKALDATNRYPHVIWPEHCLIGDEGNNIYPVLQKAIHEWERTRFAIPTIVTKGSNPWTEHFSAVQAEVPDPEDPTTQVNTEFVLALEQADVILLAGEARSHCLANTVRDVVNSFSDPKYIEKLVLLTDATSDVPGFESYGEAFLTEMVQKGMKTSTTVDYLS